SSDLGIAKVALKLVFDIGIVREVECKRYIRPHEITAKVHYGMGEHALFNGFSSGRIIERAEACPLAIYGGQIDRSVSRLSGPADIASLIDVKYLVDKVLGRKRKFSAVKCIVTEHLKVAE